MATHTLIAQPQSCLLGALTLPSQETKTPFSSDFLPNKGAGKEGALKSWPAPGGALSQGHGGTAGQS